MWVLQRRCSNGFSHWGLVILLTLIIIGGVAVLISWLTIKPRDLYVSVEDAWLRNLVVDKTNNLSATISLTFKVINPNHEVFIYYHTLDVNVVFKEHNVLYSASGFFVPYELNTLYYSDTYDLQDQPVSLSEDVKDLRNQTRSGELGCDLVGNFTYRYKSGILKSRIHYGGFNCSHVMFSLSSNNFNKTDHNNCNVDLM